ncbi:MAG: MBG domain-containing protein [Xanthobacteraceae bacterium]
MAAAAALHAAMPVGGHAANSIGDIGPRGVYSHDHGGRGHINGGSPGAASGSGVGAVGHHDFGALMRGEGGHSPITVQRSGNSLDVSGDGFLQIGVRRGSRATPIVPSNGLVTMDGAALHQAARAVVNVPAATDAHSASGRSGAISLGGESRAVAATPPHRGKLTADPPADGARILGTMPAATAASHAASLAAAWNAGRPDGAHHETPNQARAAAQSNRNPANITTLDPQAIIISETAPTHLSSGISVINVTALDAMLAGGSVALDAGSIKLAPGTVLTWLSANTLTLESTSTITIAGSISAPNGLLILMATGALADTTASKIITAGINLLGGSVTLAGSWATSGGPIAIAGVNAVTLASSAFIAANGAQGGSVQISSSLGPVQISGRVSATGATGNGGTIGITGSNISLLGALVDASGATGGGIKLISGGNLNLAGTLLATGSEAGQSGGSVETSGQTVRISGQVNAGRGGTWLLDPNDLTIDAALASTIDTALNAGTSVTEQTTASGTGGSGDIIVASPLAWSTSASLTFSAYRNIDVNANITSSAGGAVTLYADNSGTGTGTVNFGGSNQVSTSGAVSIFYNPTGNNNSTVNVTSYTSPTNYSGNIANGGALTAYMLVNTLYDLQNVENNLSGTYALGGNIGASATSAWNANAGFTPIGTLAVPFNGTFDGLGYTVSGLTINLPATADVGLFGSTGTASTIQNVGLIGGSVIGLSSAGGLVGSNTGAISNSYTTGSVTGGSSLGGLTGSNTGTVNNSSATGSVSGTSSLGGLMGSNTGTVSYSYATGNVNGTSSLGGLMGSNTGAVSNSYATGNVTGTSSLGGLMGSSTTGPVSNSYATGNVSGTTSVGGLMGSSTGPVIDTYATGAVSGTTSVGGLMGTSSGPVSNSYWNTQTSGQPTSPGGTGLTSAQMLQSANFNSWDFAHTWIIYNGLTDPLLQSFMTPLAVTANNATETYNGQPYSGGNGVTYSSNPTGNLLGTVNYSGTSQGAVNVSTYAITPGGLYSNQQGYIISYASGTITITAAALSVTANAQSRVYGAANPTLTYTDTGLVNGDTLTGALATTASSTSSVAGSPYAITQGTLAASSNYTLSYTGANLTVTAAALSVTANAQTRVYGTANPPLTYTETGLVNGDTLMGALATTATVTSSVAGSPYAITQGTLAASSNYTLSYTGANLTVTEQPVIPVVNNPPVIDGAQFGVYPSSFVLDNALGYDDYGFGSYAVGSNDYGFTSNTLGNTEYSFVSGALVNDGNGFCVGVSQHGPGRAGLHAGRCLEATRSIQSYRSNRRELRHLQ